jgi:hypothetical protein
LSHSISRQHTNLKLPHLTEGGADQAAASESQKEKNKNKQTNKKHYQSTWQDYDRASA